MNNLPEDLVRDVLARAVGFSGRTAQKLRCVSKLWKTLIDSLEIRHKGRLIALSVINCLYIMDECFDSPEYHIRLIELNNNRGKDIEFVGSCNGIVCLLYTTKDESQVVVLNPGTKQVVELPPCTWVKGSVSFGFGYDNVTDDFKVVRLVGDKKSQQVYRFRSKCWSDFVEDPGHDIVVQYSGAERGVLVNGALHWIMLRRGTHDEYNIVALDLATEKYRTLAPLPVESSAFSGKGHSFGDVEGCLTLILKDIRRIDGWFNMWIMKEYGVQNSWTKLSTQKQNTRYNFMDDSVYEQFMRSMLSCNFDVRTVKPVMSSIIIREPTQCMKNRVIVFRAENKVDDLILWDITTGFKGVHVFIPSLVNLPAQN